jgi:hypothetical protein
MGQIATCGADNGRTWGQNRARMVVGGGESHLTEHDRSAYRPADHSRTTTIVTSDEPWFYWEID